MIDFHPVSLSDLEWVRELLAHADFRGAEYCFGNIFIWKEAYGCDIARLGDHFVAKVGTGGPRYCYPAGKGDVRPVLQALWEDAKERGGPFRMHGILKEHIPVMEELFPGKLRFEEVRNSFDYLYTWEKLANLRGKHLHGKRNHIARFEERNDWVYEPITRENLPDCMRMNAEWYRQNHHDGDISLENEAKTIELAFQHFFDLDLFGGLIRVDGRVIAFTIGERINSDTVDVHIEKAFHDIQGAYPIINREFVRNACKDFTYINREEDMGVEGLRKAKLSYQPDILLVKYRASEIV